MINQLLITIETPDDLGVDLVIPIGDGIKDSIVQTIESLELGSRADIKITVVAMPDMFRSPL